MSMADRDGQLRYDGKLVPWRSATTHVLTHSLHYGLAVFEGMRAYNTVRGTAIFRLQEHVDRLFNERPLLWEGEAFLDKPFTAAGLLEAVSLILHGTTRKGAGTDRR